MRKLLFTTRVFFLLLLSLFSSHGLAAGLTTVSDAVWNETAVRKVLHTFAYGGLATDDQISAWADLPPTSAIQQILTFAASNPQLAPAVPSDNTANRGSTLENFQNFLPSAQPDNLTCPNNRQRYNITRVRADGNTVLSNSGLQHTWIDMVNKRGLN